jgi:hypothetical protein
MRTILVIEEGMRVEEEMLKGFLGNMTYGQASLDAVSRNPEDFTRLKALDDQRSFGWYTPRDGV